SDSRTRASFSASKLTTIARRGAGGCTATVAGTDCGAGGRAHAPARTRGSRMRTAHRLRLWINTTSTGLSRGQEAPRRGRARAAGGYCHAAHRGKERETLLTGLLHGRLACVPCPTAPRA